MTVCRWLLLFLTVIVDVSLAGTLELKNGAVIPGKLKGVEHEKIIWDADLIGIIKVSHDDVATLTDLAPPSLRAGKIEIPTGCPVSVDHDAWTFDCAGSTSTLARWGDIGRVNRLREGRGKVTTQLTLDRGNKSTDEYEIDAEASWRRARFRHTLEASIDYEEKFGEKTDDEAELNYQLDRLLRDGWFTYSRVDYNRDRFSTRQESNIVGIGAGHTWSFGSSTDFKLQAGLTHGWFDLSEYGHVAEPGGEIRWRVDHDLSLGRFDLTLYQEGEFSWLLKDRDLGRLYAKSGIEVPLLSGIIAELRFEYERIGVNIPEFDNTEIEWVLALGYRW